MAFSEDTPDTPAPPEVEAEAPQPVPQPVNIPYLARSRGTYPLIGERTLVPATWDRQRPSLRGKNRRWIGGEQPPKPNQTKTQLTPRDVRVLTTVARFRMLMPDQIAVLCDDDAGHWRRDLRLVKNRLSKLAADGWLSCEPLAKLGQGRSVYVVGPNGWKVVEPLTGLKRRNVSGKAYDHELTLADVAIKLLQDNPGAAWTTEMELRANLVARGIIQENKKNPAVDEKKSNHGKAVGTANRVPDGLLSFPDEQDRLPILVEVQLSDKSEKYFTDRMKDLTNPYTGLHLKFGTAQVRWVVVNKTLEAKLNTYIKRSKLQEEQSVVRYTERDGIRVLW